MKQLYISNLEVSEVSTISSPLKHLKRMSPKTQGSVKCLDMLFFLVDNSRFLLFYPNFSGTYLEHVYSENTKNDLKSYPDPTVLPIHLLPNLQIHPNTKVWLFKFTELSINKLPWLEFHSESCKAMHF